MNVIRLLRPHQWIKNGFVLVGVIFGHNLLLLNTALLATLAFCFMSSAVYIYNDIIDQPIDKLHPLKKNRPLAAGKISIQTAGIMAIMLFLFSIALGLRASPTVAIILGSYFILNIFYTHILKNIVLVDVFCISAGFMLRILAGTIGVGIPPSPWLLFCSSSLTLLLGFAKRRAEITSSPDLRKVLKDYNQIFLDKMIGITASCSIIGYALYTMHQNNNLIYTLPFVIYGIFRYLYLLHNHKGGEDAAKDLMKDRQFMLAVLGWILAVVYMIF